MKMIDILTTVVLLSMIACVQLLTPTAPDDESLIGGIIHLPMSQAHNVDILL